MSGPAWLLLLLTTTAASPLLSRVRRIVGGKKSRAGKHPWQAYLELTDKAGEETRYFTVRHFLTVESGGSSVLHSAKR